MEDQSRAIFVWENSEEQITKKDRKRTITTKAISSLLMLLYLSACATPHAVDINAIEANKHKTFKLGIVKVAGIMSYLMPIRLMKRW